MNSTIAYSDIYLKFNIGLNDPALNNFVPNSYIFSVGDKNPLSGYESEGKYKYYYIRNFSGNIDINVVSQISTSQIPTSTTATFLNVYYVLIGSGANIVDSNNLIIDPNYVNNKVYSCGSSGPIYPLSKPSRIMISGDKTLTFTGNLNTDLANNPTNIDKYTYLELKSPGNTINNLDNSNTRNPTSIKNSPNVKSAINTGGINFSGIPPPGINDSIKNYGEYINGLGINNTFTIANAKFTEVPFADSTKKYRHYGGRYINENKIPQNGEPNGLLLYFPVSSTGGTGNPN
jgi:hypothetical protein